MDPRQLIQRLVQLKQESQAIMQQLTSAGIPPEAIMAALQGGQGGPPRGPNIPTPANGRAGIDATNTAMGMGGGRGLPPGMPQGGPPQGMPRGLLGGM